MMLNTAQEILDHARALHAEFQLVIPPAHITGLAVYVEWLHQEEVVEVTAFGRMRFHGVKSSDGNLVERPKLRMDYRIKQFDFINFGIDELRDMIIHDVSRVFSPEFIAANSSLNVVQTRIDKSWGLAVDGPAARKGFS